MTGLRFTTRVVEEFTQNPNNWAPRGEQPLDETGKLNIITKYYYNCHSLNNIFIINKLAYYHE